MLQTLSNLPPRRWATSAFDGSASTFATDLATLGDHTARCQRQRGALFDLRRAGDALKAFAARRMVTTWFLCVLLSIGASWVG